jgi:hypothetical protein
MNLLSSEIVDYFNGSCKLTARSYLIFEILKVATFIVLAIDCEIKFLSENMRYRL